MKKRMMTLALIAVMTISVFAGCGKQGTSTKETETSQNEQTEEKDTDTDTGEGDRKKEQIEPIKIGFLKGPTALGAAVLMNEMDHGIVFGTYDITLYDTVEEVKGKIISGELDVAAIPVNLGAALYNATDGQVLMAAVNTLGTLYLVERGSSITEVSDLEGKTVVMAGQGSVPEYVFQFILDKAGVLDCEIEFVPSHAEAVAAVVSGKAGVALLPEPFASMAESKGQGLNIVLDVAKEWDAYSYEEDDVPNTLTMGCIIVRKEYLENNQKAFNKFLDEYEYFMEIATEDPALTAEYAVTYGILEDAAVAEKAIPNCNIVYIDDSKMLRLTGNFYKIMYESNPKSIGGAIPDSDFYYVR